jgi:hypothetical protein
MIVSVGVGASGVMVGVGVVDGVSVGVDVAGTGVGVYVLDGIGVLVGAEVFDGTGVDV